MREAPTAFFQRIDVPLAKRALADLERLTAEDAVPEDYVDLGDDEEMTLVTMQGECIA